MARAQLVFAVLLILSGCKQSKTDNAHSGDAGWNTGAAASDAGPEAGTEEDAGDDWGLPPAALPDAEFKAGSRLRPVFTTLGSAKVFAHWFDTELGAECEFRTSAQGQIVCMPWGSPIVYATPDCATPLLVGTAALAGTPLYDYAFEVRAHDQCVGYVLNRVLKRGAALTQRPATLYFLDGGRCAEASPSAEAMIYEASAVSADILVAESGVRHAGSGRLRATYREMSDGSIERLGWYDAALPMPCAPHSDYGNAQCLPKSNGYRLGETLVGETCNEAAQLAFSCGDPFVLGYASDDNGVETPAIWKLEQQLAPFISRKDPNYPDLCLPERTEYEVWRASAVTVDNFASMAVESSKGRIALQVQRAKGLPDYAPQELAYRDTLLDMECRVGLAHDGKNRCLPWAIGGVRFLDSECAERVYHHYFFGRDPGLPNYVSYQDYVSSRATAYRVGVEVAENVDLFYLGDEGCVGEGSSEGKVYAVEEVAPEAFVEAVSVME